MNERISYVAKTLLHKRQIASETTKKLDINKNVENFRSGHITGSDTEKFGRPVEVKVMDDRRSCEIRSALSILNRRVHDIFN